MIISERKKHKAGKAGRSRTREVILKKKKKKECQA
jgi:hypothetical protein